MSASMVYRGPDDEGIYQDRGRGVALGARRLSILDLQGGHQPLSNEDRTVWAVLNGEIYNYPRLRERLAAKGHVFRTRTDTEVLVHLYEEYGSDLVHALDGMYAIAVWDSGRRRLMLARDRFGEKPLFYRSSGGDLAFASELSALLVGGGPDGELDPRAVDAYFVLGYVPTPQSVIRGVNQLSPGCLLVWEAESGSATERRYWTPAAFDSKVAPVPPRQLQLEFERLFDDSVRTRMAADVPVGVFLSGGVDSAVVAACAARHSTTPIKTFTVDYEVGNVGERAAARAVARRLGADHHELTLQTRHVAASVVPLLAGLDQPLADQAVVALNALSRFARPQIKVALGGEGADELLGGYPRYRWLTQAQRLERWLPDQLARSAAGVVQALPMGAKGDRLATVVRPQSLIKRHLSWVTSGRADARSAVYGSRLNGVSSPVPAGAGGSTDGNAGASLMALDLRHWLPDDVLTKADRASMRASLELRAPYLQYELADWAANIPLSDHLRDGGKSLIRRLLQTWLPGIDARVRKRAFRVPACAWLRGPLAPAMRDQIGQGALYEEGWFNREPVRRTFEAHVTGRIDATEVLWPTFALGLWLDRVRGQGPE